RAPRTTIFAAAAQVRGTDRLLPVQADLAAKTTPSHTSKISNPIRNRPIKFGDFLTSAAPTRSTPKSRHFVPQTRFIQLGGSISRLDAVFLSLSQRRRF